MSFSDTAAAKKYAGIAEVAAGEAKSFAEYTRQAENFSVQAKASAEDAAQSALDAGLSKDAASESAAGAATSEASAGESAAAAEVSAQNASLASNVYESVEAAQAAITAGDIPVSGLFNVVGTTDSSFIDQYKNVDGTATPTGKSYPSVDYIDVLSGKIDLQKVITDLINRVLPPALMNTISGYHFMVSDISGNKGLLGLNDGGGLEVAGINGNVQNYLQNIVSTTISITASGYQFVLATLDNTKALAAIDDNGYLWLAGMAKSVQQAIADASSATGERLARPDGTGKIALYPSTNSSTVLWGYSPVVSAAKVTDSGISFTYNESGVLKSALIPTIEAQASDLAREIGNAINEMHFYAGRGQSLRVGANGGAVSADSSLIGHCLMFSGAGKDRGAGIDGDVTDINLGALTDGRIVNFRNNCQVPAAQTILKNHLSRSISTSGLPIIVTRLDARGGFSYSQLMKGTQPYIDGTTSFDSFCKRAESIGKLPKCKVIGFTHGEADANVTSLQFGTYKGYLTQWSNDTQADMIARSGQADIIWLDVDQVGSLTNTTVISGITQRGYVVAIDQWEFTKERTEAFMSIPKWLLNRTFPQDFLHLTGLGYRILGEYQGKAEDWTIYDRVNNPSGAKFKPVQPESIVKVNNTTFDITFSSPYGKPLQIKAVNGITAPNLGFDLQNGSANVTSVTQQGNFVFRVVTDVAPTIGDYFRLGCTANDNGANSYPMVNIFDTTTTVSSFDPTFVMANPCAISRIAVI